MELYKKRLNREKLQEILDCFVEITGIRAAYFDSTVENLSGKNLDSCAFCKSIRQIAAINEGCIRNDETAFNRSKETKSPYLYQCHIGLWEAVVPLMVKDNLAGFLMIGQVKSSDFERTWNDIEAALRSMQTASEKVEDIKNKFIQLPVYQMNQIKAALKMLEIIAQNIINSDIILLYNSSLVEKAKEYLKQHYTENISIKVLAAELDISQSSLITLFKREVGATITEYTENLRMGKARELLLLSPLSVKEIAYQCGYVDQNYFSRVFKKSENLSPIEFRKAQKE